MEIQSSFLQLNDKVINYFQNNCESLQAAKELFLFLSSTRQLEQIDSIQKLLKALKRKGLYDANECRTTLRIFLKIIIDDDFANMVESHNHLLSQSHVEEPLRNIYGKKIIPFYFSLKFFHYLKIAEKRMKDEVQSQSRPPPLQSTSSTRANNSKRNEVLVTISNAISSADFRRLARLLDLESEIFELEASERLQSTRNMLLLSKYEEREQRIDVNKLIGFLKFLNLEILADEVRQILRK
jgi:hypothetical protein